LDEVETNPSGLFSCPVCGTWRLVLFEDSLSNFEEHTRPELKSDVDRKALRYR